MIDILVEILFEVFCEGFISLVDVFLPKQPKSHGLRGAITIVFLLLACALLVGLVIGVVLLLENRGSSFWGWLLVSANVVYVSTALLLKFCRRKQEKGKKAKG